MTDWVAEVKCLQEQVAKLRGELNSLRAPRLRDEWEEEDGNVLWWLLPVREPPYVGTPLDDDFPEYVTHWTPIPLPLEEGTADERLAPVQGDHRIPRGQPGREYGTIAWEEHVRAWEAYAKRYGNDQSAERLAERGGYGYRELIMFLGHEPTTWRPR